MTQSVAILGAGMAGLTCAQSLRSQGHSVTVFDKGRGPGGRTSLRRSTDERFAFDHGAQYFTARDAGFSSQVERWQSAGVVAPWEGRIVALEEAGPRSTPEQLRWVGIPGMNAVAKYLAEDVELHARTRVEAAEQGAGGWMLRSEGGGSFGPFERLVLTLPTEQCLPFLRPNSPLHEYVRATHMSPSVAWMVGFEAPWSVDFDGAFVNRGGRLSWLARNSSKPGRPGGDAWVIHTAPAMAAEIFESGREGQAAAMQEALLELQLPDLPPVAVWDVHRWKFALLSEENTPESLRVAAASGYLEDEETGLLIAGDWCHGSRVEGAFLSGRAAAARVGR